MEQFAKYQNFLAFKVHPIAKKFLNSEADIRCIFKGNQGGGTGTVMFDLANRLLGTHPIVKRNRLEKPVRCVSKVVPQDHDDEENQQFVELKRLLPPEMITKKLTARSKVMSVRNPYGGADNKVEFMSSSQELDAFMSVQRSAYYQDEEIDRMKWDESLKRLLKAGGDVCVSVTPVKGLDWMYDGLWCKAEKIYRSQAICDRFNYPAVEEGGRRTGIECFCWATDDNPVLEKDSIERIFENFDDPDELAMARYGVFRQISGKIYKSFDKRVHVVKFGDYFNEDLFRTYWHYRIIDFHPRKPWYISFVAISPTHEWFVWREMVASHDAKTTYEMRDDIKNNSLLDEDDEFNRATLIDPLSKVQQGNTGYTTFDDVSRGENGLRRLTEADTRGSVVHGRENVKMRLRNALKCQYPGNNLNSGGVFESRYGNYLPTLWIMDSCPKHIEQIDGWRYVDFVQEKVKATRTIKRESEKNQDFCRNLEFLGVLNPVVWNLHKEDNYWEPSKLFHGNRRAA